eukprot:CAMPEP_0174260406 /NCGR_PEP_ID=MMETSP0439-20130205/9696_1 /TAXON_ID=0 /ORGANISM="Stereomyxa ramosa, Strain Chinc5" /LENGTH=245 /DNA_ID=CAMNT_0015344649 /DNA_START=28 /DNA_END=766 /DNA_ORIENTATION=+
MIESFFILNGAGVIIIEKHFCGLVSRSICDKFWEVVMDSKNAEDVPPIISHGAHWYLFHKQHNGIYFLAIVQTETPPLLVLEFLERVVEVFQHYMEEITEDEIKNQFVTVYQVLDEMMDGGFPFTTEPNVLTVMVNRNNILTDLMGNMPLPGTMALPVPMRVDGKLTMGEKTFSLTNPSSVKQHIPSGTTTNVPWRAAGVRYATNEIYFDATEEIDCIIGRTGRVVKCEVYGTVQQIADFLGCPT